MTEPSGEEAAVDRFPPGGHLTCPADLNLFCVSLCVPCLTCPARPSSSCGLDGRRGAVMKLYHANIGWMFARTGHCGCHSRLPHVHLPGFVTTPKL